MGGNWAASYNPMNMNNLNNMNNNMNMQQSPGKMNVVFKTTNGNIKNVQIDIGKTIGELIILYLKRMDRENLIGNERDICFLYDAAKLKYDDNRKIEQAFKFGNPSVMVNDVQNLIGAYWVLFREFNIKIYKIKNMMFFKLFINDFILFL